MPTVSIFEVFERVLAQRDESLALQAVALMHQGRIVDRTAFLAFDAVLWTQDADFEGVEGVRFTAARPG